ncbi:Uncharacterised protein [Mycobacterium tuberculosis]|nr:Uncharacterised protein [Mycobacterium tuberculosis]COZ01230.1 Uncharacterised protein [Mycobacterium tuberculosis]
MSRSACSSRYASLDWNSDIGRTHSRAPAGSSSFTVVVILARTPRMFLTALRRASIAESPSAS